MKTIIIVLLAVCAYGQAASTGAKAEVKGNELVYTTADQTIFRISYVVPGYSMKWFDAQLACLDAGYKGLLSIKSEAAQQAADYALVSYGVTSSAWVGLHRPTATDSWTWADGTALGTYTNWYTASSNTSIGGGYVYPAGVNVGKWGVAATATSYSRCLCEY